MGDYAWLYGSTTKNNIPPSNNITPTIYEGKTSKEQIAELKRLSAEATEKANYDKLELEEANRKQEEIQKLELEQTEIERKEQELRQMEEDKRKKEEEIARKKEEIRKNKENFNKNIKAAFIWFMKTSASAVASGVKTGYKYLIKDRFKLGGAKKSNKQIKSKTKRQTKNSKKRQTKKSRKRR